MISKRHLLLSVPESWDNTKKGSFFEEFISEILKPMRFSINSQLRVTGMEIDLLAKGEDQPRTVLVECKAYREALSADVISKLLGNVAIRKADEGWLFSTSDLTKDGKGLWEEIQNDIELRKKFTWYAPERIINVLVDQKSVVDPLTLSQALIGYNAGDWTLIIVPSGFFWLVELIEDGIPTRYSIFNARTGNPAPAQTATDVAQVSPRFSSLLFQEIINTVANTPGSKIQRAPVAKVISGDFWDDPRPARPTDFVGRDDSIKEIIEFIEQVRTGISSTRTFAIIGPSGWGKSSLILKIGDILTKKHRSHISITSIDTRSATNSAFVSESIRIAFLDAAKIKLLTHSSEFNILSLRDPLESPDFIEAIEVIRKNSSCIVLIFDQFEELFAREDLFEIFNAVRELSLDIDARQAPIILGFAWKTDISLPQLHPAYHLWHQLADRRKTFKIREFGSKDIQKIIYKAQKALGEKLSPALKTRLLEQCQGFPWLLKKLLVHVLKKVSTTESQYLLLERELDIIQLFKEDLSLIGDEQIRCLKYVASKGPITVTEVEQNFSRETTNHLINSHLLIRSGMNYVVYWDIFRDYLNEEKVPYIPWTRTFQSGPSAAFKVLLILSEIHSATGTELAAKIGHASINPTGDLLALQLVELNTSGQYSIARHLNDLKPLSVAQFVQGQFRRHVVVKEIISKWEKEKPISIENWSSFFAEVHPRTSNFSDVTIKTYAVNLKNWLLFAGILEQKGNTIYRPTGDGEEMGVLSSMKINIGTFLGTASPKKLELLFQLLHRDKVGLSRHSLEEKGLRNAIADGFALGLLQAEPNKYVSLKERNKDLIELLNWAKSSVRETVTTKIVASTQDIDEACKRLKEQIGPNWKDISAKRYARGLKQYLKWAKVITDTPLFGDTEINR